MPYIGKTTDGFGIRERFTYLASAGATSISGADANGKTLLYEDPEYVDVFLNGIRLKKGTDYNTSTANTIAGLAALALNDEVEVIVQDVFTLADMVSANTGGDFRGNIAIQKDSGVLSFGADKEITVTHSADTGLVFKNTNTGDDKPFTLTLQTGETDIAASDKLGVINFQAPDEGTGTDAILVAAGIEAVSEGDFSSSNNATKLSFKTASSAAAAETMSLSSAGNLTVSGTFTGGGLMTTGGNIIIPDGGFIGSASDANAVAISSAGVVTISTDTDSTSSTSGALIAHSAGFADDVFIGDDLEVGGGVIALKNTGSQSQLRLYCESSNAHYAALQAPAHSDFSGNTVLTLPATTDTIAGIAATQTLTNKTLTTPVIAEITSGSTITLNATTDIVLDADGANVTFKDNGTSILDIANNSSDVELTVSVADKNFKVKGTDGSSAITALDIDMALVGQATFSGAVIASGAITGGGLLTTGGNIVIPDAGNIGSASDTDAIAIASNGQVTFTQTLIGTALDISGDIDVDGTTNLDVVDIDGAVDMASTLQVDGAITSSAGMTITTADNTAQLELVSTDADSGIGPHQVFYRNSSSPADGDLLCELDFRGRNDNSQDVDYAVINVKANDVSDGTEDGEYILQVMTAGSVDTTMHIKPAEIVFNEDSIDRDFRVESNGNANMLFVDGGNDSVLMGGTETVVYADTSGNQLEYGSYFAVKRETANASQAVAYFNNTGADGNIIDFRKDGTSVGTINSASGGYIAIGQTNTFLQFHDSLDAIYASDGASGRDNAIDLGTSIVRFDDIYATNGTIQTSDQQEKNTITDSDLGIDFIKRLTPKSYIFNGKTRTHYGLIAQDVETVLSDISKPTSGFAGFIKDDISEEQDGSEYRYGLRYTEFVAPLIQAVKDQQATIDALTARITALENGE